MEQFLIVDNHMIDIEGASREELLSLREAVSERLCDLEEGAP